MFRGKKTLVQGYAEEATSQRWGRRELIQIKTRCLSGISVYGIVGCHAPGDGDGWLEIVW